MELTITESHKSLSIELNNHNAIKQDDSIDQALHEWQPMHVTSEERLDKGGTELHRDNGGSLRESQAAQRI
eukprot:3383317-Karenia_brevis.AAC.1